MGSFGTIQPHDLLCRLVPLHPVREIRMSLKIQIADSEWPSVSSERDTCKQSIQERRWIFRNHSVRYQAIIQILAKSGWQQGITGCFVERDANSKRREMNAAFASLTLDNWLDV